MSGLVLAKQFYTASLPILEHMIPDLLPQACFGLVGEGSECFGLDDAISTDHDSGPGFCCWLPAAQINQNKSRLEAAFASLPTTFAGQQTRMQPPRLGLLSIEAFYEGFLGFAHVPKNHTQWLTLQEPKLACATNGEIFVDHAGEFSRIRAGLLAFYPEEVWVTKIASRCMQMAQAGQYNLLRCQKRRDEPACMLCKAKFSEAALSMVALLNKRWLPFYKHAPRIVQTLPILGQELIALLNTLSNRTDTSQIQAIEAFCSQCASYLFSANISPISDSWLWVHGQTIMENVSDPILRACNLLSL